MGIVSRRIGGLSGLSFVATTGLLGAYVGYPGLRKAHAATTCEVTKTSDTIAPLTEGELRYCLEQVNSAGVDAITFAAVTDGTSISLNNDLPQVTVTSSLTITGNGVDSTVIDGQDPGNPGHGGLYFNGSGTGTVTVTGIKIQNTYRSFGGAIDIDSGDLTVTDSSLDSNSADSDGGAINIAYGDLTVTDSSFDSNSAIYRDGGAINIAFGDLTVTDSSFASNSAGNDSDGDGGAISIINGDHSVTGTNFSSNRAGDDGGAMSLSNYATLSVSNSTFTNNGSGNDGGSGSSDGGAINASGDVTISNSTFTGNAAVESDAEGGAIETSDGHVTVTDSTFTSNSAGDHGGAIRTSDGDITVSGSTFTNMSAENDGGVFDTDGGNVTISDSTFTANSANTSDKNGGVVDTDDGNITVTGSTFSGNTSTGDSGAIGTDDGAITLTNSTLSGNSAAEGGAVFVGEGGGSVTLDFVTVSGNTTSGGSSAAVDSAGDATVTNSIVYGNTGGDVKAGGTLSVSFSLFTSTSSVSPTVSGDTLIFGEDPLLGALADNGGPTVGASGEAMLTMLPAAGSPVIGTANPDTDVTEDQRGFSRTTDGLADMGAVQVGGVAPEPDLSQVPPSWHQAQGREQQESVCPPGMAPSWAQWPNEGTGGWTCEYTTWWDVNKGVDGGWVTTPGFRAGRIPGL